MSSISFTMLARTATLVFCLLTAAPSFAAEPLVWKLTPGVKNRFEMTRDMQVTKSGAGGDFTSTVQMTMDTSWVVQSVKDDGSAVLKENIDRMQMKISTGDGQATQIDSAAKEEPQGQAAMLAPFLKAMTSNPYTVTMTPRGEIKEVQVPDAIAEALKTQPGAAQMGDMATSEGFKKLVAQASFVLPEKLEPGVEWKQKSETDLPALGTQIVETTYRYEGPDSKDKNLEKFSAKIAVSFQGGQVAVAIPKQESQGEILFNREAGRLESSHLHQKTDLKITVLNNVINQSMDMTVDMKWLPEEKEKK